MAERQPKRRTIEELRRLVRSGRYAIKTHAVRHAIAEGFTERDIIAAVMFGRTLAVYPLDERMLILGYISLNRRIRIPLHVVLEYSETSFVDVVTAFIPANPHHVVSRARLAVLLKQCRHEVKAEVVGPARVLRTGTEG